MKIPEYGGDHRGGDAPQPDRPDDHDAGRRRRDPRAVGRGDRVHQRRGHRRRRRRVRHRFVTPSHAAGDVVSGRVLVVGSVNVDLVVRARAPARARRDRARRDVRPVPRRQGRQPGRGRRPARGAGRARRGAGRRRRSATRRSTALDGAGRRDLDASCRLDGTATGVALILVDADGENLIAVAPGANAAADRGPGPRRARRASSPRPGDVVLVVHEIPTGRGPRGPPPGPRARRDHGVQPGARVRPRPRDPRPGRRPDAQPRRARQPRDRRCAPLRVARRPAPRTRSAPRGRCSTRPAKDRASAARSSSRSARPGRSSSSATDPRSTSPRRR